MIVLYEHDEIAFTSQGLGALTDVTKCTVTEELNGEYELEMEYPINGNHYEEIALRRIILARPNTNDRAQPFRIYEISKPINGIVTVNAQHISYDLSDFIVDPAHNSTQRPLTTPKVFKGASDFFSTVGSCLVKGQTCNFAFSTDLTDEKEMAVSIPTSIRSLMSDDDGKARNIWPSGEYYFDRFSVKYLQHRGENRGVSIRYGKNLTDLKQEENCSEVYTGIYPYWYQENDGLQWLGDYSSPIINISDVYSDVNYDFERILPLDLTNEISDDQSKDTDESNDGRMPSQATLREKAIEYIKTNDIGTPKVSLDVSFINLRQSSEYEMVESLEDIRLGDTVNIVFPELGIESIVECVKTEYNCINNMYESIELGEPTGSLSDTIAGQSNSLGGIGASIRSAASSSTSETETIVIEKVEQATGSSGGNVIMRSSTGGLKPDEILIMDADNLSEAKCIIRLNKVGIQWTNGGYSGPWSTVLDITTGKIGSGVISGLTETIANAISAHNTASDSHSDIRADINSLKTLESVTTEKPIKVTKSFNDWSKADSFIFDLAAVTENAPMPALTEATATQQSPTAAFGEVTYTKAGKYEYTITERNGGADGVSYDVTPHTVTVEVKKADDATNKLTATVKYDSTKDDLTVTNTYTAVETDAYAVFDSSDGSFTFFRDTPGKYTDGQVSGTKTYYTGFEDITGATDPSWYNSRNDEQKNIIKTVTFKDKINPKTCYDWFSGASSLASITGLDKLDTENVTNMKWMFFNCRSLTDLDVSSFNTANVTNMSWMFQNCTGLTSLNVSSFNTAAVTGMSGMLYNCSKLKTIYASSLFTTDAVISSTDMFDGCTSLVGGAGTKYDANHKDKTYARIDGGTSRPGYFTAKAAPAKASLQR